MMRMVLFLWCCLPAALLAEPETVPFDKSAYFAFADRDYIFTIELVRPGVPLLNFVSMTDRDARLSAKNVQLTLGNRKATVSLFAVEVGRSQEPVLLASLTINPRSSFGIRLEGNFGQAPELHGATIRIENDVFHLSPLSGFDFEDLVAKINRLNLDSPDFRDDWRVLRLERIGDRFPDRR
jgi:hypothetical protein